MRAMLFINKNYFAFEKFFLPFLRLGVLISFILILLFLFVGVRQWEDLAISEALQDKIVKKIELNDQSKNNKNIDLEFFQQKISMIKSITGLSSNLDPVDIFNILENSLPEKVRVISLEYHDGEHEYIINALTNNKEQISNFLEKLQESKIREATLVGQRQSDSEYQFSILIKV